MLKIEVLKDELWAIFVVAFRVVFPDFALGVDAAKRGGGPLVNCARPSESFDFAQDRLKNRRMRRRFCTATARPRHAGETPSNSIAVILLSNID